MNERLLAWLPWYILDVAMLFGIARQAATLTDRRYRVRGLINIVALLLLGMAWTLIVISTESMPILERAEAMKIVHAAVLAGACIWIAIDLYDAIIAVREHRLLYRRR